MSEVTPEQAEVEAAEPEASLRWFVLRVQSNREETVRDSLEKLLELERMKTRVPEILVPTESVTELRSGKRQVVSGEHGHSSEHIDFRLMLTLFLLFIRNLAGISHVSTRASPRPQRRRFGPSASVRITPHSVLQGDFPWATLFRHSRLISMPGSDVRSIPL